MSADLGQLLHDGPSGAAVIFAFAHGAGGPMDHPAMQSLATGLGGAGIRVVRFEFPYMRTRREEGSRRGPDSLPRLLATWRAMIEHLAATKLVIAGRSMGGRIASMVADEMQVAGLVCFGYPFHPPGRPEQLRTQHLAQLRTPALILQGERDPFGTRDDVVGYTLSPAIEVEWIADGDHTLKPRKSSGRTVADNEAATIAAVVAFVAKLK